MVATQKHSNASLDINKSTISKWHFALKYELEAFE